MEKMPKIVSLISLQIDNSINSDLRQVNLLGMCSHPNTVILTDCDVNQESEAIWVLLIHSALELEIERRSKKT